MNVFLRGDRGVGKSTLVDRVITRLGAEGPLRLGGFMSFRDPGSGVVSVARAALPRGGFDLIPVAKVGEGALPGAFDGPARDLLTPAGDWDLIVLDELGFFEQNAPAFQEAILGCLDGAVPVLGVLKSREVPWYERILAREDVTVLEVNEETRDHLAQEVLRQLNVKKTTAPG